MKKKNLFKRAAALAMAGVMSLSLAACGSDGGSTSSDTTNTGDTGNAGNTSDAGVTDADTGSAQAVTEMEDTTINIRVMNEFKNLDKVIAKYTEMTKDDPIMSKIHLNFQWVAGGDYKDKLTMSLAAVVSSNL